MTQDFFIDWGFEKESNLMLLISLGFF